jgi:aspartate carbamoyltransferase catalytic subunit
LSADVISFSAAQSSVKETLIDTVNNILSADMVVMRHAVHARAAYFLSKNVKQESIINAGDGAHERLLKLCSDSYSIRGKN